MSYGENQNPYASPQFHGHEFPSSQSSILATRGERLVGALLDRLIVGAVNFVLGMGLGFFLVAVMGMKPTGFDFQVTAAILGRLMGAAVYLLFNGYLLANYGQSIGKLIVKTRIVSNDDQPVPFVSLVLKRYLPLWIVASIPYIGIFFVLINALLIFRENRKCFHDELAGTKVIKTV